MVCFRLTILAVVFSSLFSCTKFSVVKPEILDVKRVAVISCTDSGYLLKVGESFNIKNPLSVMNTMNNILNYSNKTSLNQTLVNYMQDQFELKLKSVPDWELVPYADLSNSIMLEAFYDIAGRESDGGRGAYNQPGLKGLKLNLFILGQNNYPPRDAAIKICKEFDLDAMIFINSDMRFEEGLFTVKSSLGLKIMIYDKNAKAIGWNSTDERYISKKTAGVVAGLIPYDSPDVKDLLLETIDAAVSFYSREIPSAMR